jgi:site-specific DNA recombinase
MKKTIIYSRVSTTMQLNNGEHHSLDHQLSKMTTYCKANELKNICHLQDAGISGKNIKDRPAFQKMLVMVKNNEIDNIIVGSLSRFARNVRDVLDCIELFNRHNIRFISLNEAIDTKSAYGKFILTVFSALNQMEREQISERISSVLQFRKSKGFAVGNVPFGKTKLADKSLVPNHQELHTLKLIGELTDKGYSIKKICTELTRRKRMNKRGIVSWKPCSIWRYQQQTK